MFLNAGDEVKWQVQTYGLATTFNNFRGVIRRLASPQTVAMGEVVAFNAARTAGHVSVSANSDVVMGFNNVELDTHGTYNASTSEYTIPVSGIYHISSYINFDLPAAAGTTFGLYIRTDEGSGFTTRKAAWHIIYGLGSNYRTVYASFVRRLKAGDKVRVNMIPTTNVTVIGDSLTTNNFSVHKIG
jgi:hypothetical protein